MRQENREQALNSYRSKQHKVQARIKRKEKDKYAVDEYTNCRRPERHKDVGRRCTCGMGRSRSIYLFKQLQEAGKGRVISGLISARRAVLEDLSPVRRIKRIAVETSRGRERFNRAA